MNLPSQADPPHPHDDALSAWTRGELPDDQASAIELHLEACDECATRLEDLRASSDPFLTRLREAVGLDAGVPAVSSASSDANLMFGALALQAGLITPQQLADGCLLWASRGGRPLSELMVEQGWIQDESRVSINRLLASRLQPAQTPAAIETLSDPSTPAPEAGSSSGVLERLRLTQLHSRGGIGQVWRAYDTQLGREIALKELLPELRASQRHRERFFREARVAAQLTHPGTAPVYEYREDDDRCYYTMRFYSGRSLSEAIAKAHHPENGEAPAAGAFERLLPLLEDFIMICETIAYAHSRGIVHRDLKGENVVLGEYGEVTVIDWGLAKSISGGGVDAVIPAPDADNHLDTIEGERLGTPAFMAPEQARGDLSAIDQRTDVYGLAAVLYEILTGRPPFSGATANEVMHLVESEAPRPPSESHPLTPARLEEICLRGLAKEKADRFASAADLRDAVREWLTRQVQQQRESERQAQFFALSHDLFVALNDSGLIQQANPACLSYLGYEPEYMVGRHYAELVHQDDVGFANSLFEQVRRGESAPEHVIRIVDSQQRAYPVSWSLTRVTGESNVYAVGRPLDEETERRRLAYERSRFFSLSRDLCVTTDSDTKVSQVNKAMLDLLGIEEEDIVGTTGAQFVHPDDLEMVVGIVERVLKGESFGGIRSRLVAPDGRVIPMEWTITRVPGENSFFSIGRVRDEETERRQAMESRAKFFALSGDLFVTYDRDFRVTQVNRAYLDAIGLDEADALGAEAQEHAAPHDANRLQRHIEGVRRGEAKPDIVVALRTKGPGQTLVEWTISRVEGEDTYYGIGRVCDEATERRRLTEARSRFFSLSRDFFITFENGKVVEVNPAYEAYLGYEGTSPTVHGRVDRVHPDDKERAELVYQQALRGVPYGETVLRILGADGEYHPVAWVLTHVPGEQVVYGVGRPADEETLRRRELDARARFFELSPSLFVISDERGLAAQINPAWKTLLGWEPGDVIGISYLEFVHPDDCARATRAGRRAMVREAVTELVTRMRCKSGEYKSINWTICRVAGDKVAYAIGREVAAL